MGIINQTNCCREINCSENEIKSKKFEDEQQIITKSKKNKITENQVEAHEIENKKNEQTTDYHQIAITSNQANLEKLDVILDEIESQFIQTQKSKLTSNLINHDTETKKKLLNQFILKYWNHNIDILDPFDRYNLIEYNISNEKIDEILNASDLVEEIFFNDENKKYFYTGTINRKQLFHGYGILRKYNGEIYEGYFDFGVFQPFGRYVSDKGDIYEGAFENGKFNGLGKLVKKNKIYYGEFHYGVKSGYGKEKTEFEEYEGDYKVDKKDGKGKLLFLKTGNIYIGDFKEGKMTGYCKFIWKNGDYYEGSILNGIFHGKGSYKWHEGMEYDGNYENGIRKGIGIYKWKEGPVYKGEFDENMPHGRGIMIENGIENEVLFEKGKIVKR